MKFNINSECVGTIKIDCNQLCLELSFLPKTFQIPCFEELLANENVNNPLQVIYHNSPSTVGTFIRCFLVVLDLLEQSEETQNSYPIQIGLTDILKELQNRGEILPKDGKEARIYVERIIERFFSTQASVYPREGSGRLTVGSLLGFICSTEWFRGKKEVVYSIQHVMIGILDECELNALRRVVGYQEKPVYGVDSLELDKKSFEWKRYLASRITATIRYGECSMMPELPSGSQMKVLAKLAGLNIDNDNVKEYDDYAEETREENLRRLKRPYKTCSISMVEICKHADLSYEDADARILFKTTVEGFIRNHFSKFVKGIRYYSDDMYSNSDSISIELWCKMSIA